jgi:menaquinone-dependent protoporphyrinogen IX oxidase
MKTDMRLGLPTDVTLYHPAEFLELNKTTLAFLDIGLEKFKGGIGHQLLVGHIVHYIQNETLKGIESLPRFKSEYLTNLVNQAKVKGIDLEKLNKETYQLNWTKAEKLSSPKMIYEPNDSFDKAADVYSSSNYAQFHYLPFNRAINQKHVRTLVGSMKRNNVTSFPLVVYTDCIDGEWKYWIIDGQHRYEAFKKLGLPVRFNLFQTEKALTKYDIVRIAADVNNSSLRWSLKQYLKSWESLDIREYTKIKTVLAESKISLTILLQAYSGLKRSAANNALIKGVYQMNDEQNGDVYIGRFITLKPHLPKTSAAYNGLLEFFRQPDLKYDEQKMIRLIESRRELFMVGTEEEIIQNMNHYYNAA